MNWKIKFISKILIDQNFAHFMRGYDKGFHGKVLKLLNFEEW